MITYVFFLLRAGAKFVGLLKADEEGRLVLTAEINGGFEDIKTLVNGYNNPLEGVVLDPNLLWVWNGHPDGVRRVEGESKEFVINEIFPGDGFGYVGYEVAREILMSSESGGQLHFLETPGGWVGTYVGLTQENLTHRDESSYLDSLREIAGEVSVVEE